MALINCKECGEQVSTEADNCNKCGRGLRWSDGDFSGLSSISTILEKDEPLKIDSGLNKTLKWFILVNAAVIISVSIISGFSATSLIPLLLVLGSIVPFGALFFSKWLAKKSHNIKILDHDSNTESEKYLLGLVDCLRKKAGIEVMPEVGVYESDDMNAFATGKSKNDSLLAFSDKLLQKMDKDELAAVVAHEIAHIANGDMITLSIVQSVTNAVVLLFSIPLMMLKIFAIFDEKSDWIMVLFISFIKIVVVSILLFLGNLVVKAFSRKREFEADKLASELINPDSMIKALKKLKGEEFSVSHSKETESFAALKISSPASRLGELFSTHPSIESRVEAIKNRGI